MTLRVLDILDGTTVDGPGFRTSIYVAGCAHHCPECHNPQSWDFDGGNDMELDDIMRVVDNADLPVTISGGDPIYQYEAVGELVRRLKAAGRNVWLYTGFTVDELFRRPELGELLKMVDVVVDGPFIAAERDLSLLFRGSRNQRAVDMRRSSPGNICLWEPEW